MELVKDLSDEKLGKVISFIKFVKEEEEPVLLLEKDDEEEVLRILEEDEWYSAEEVKEMLMEKEND
ncbi:MAG: hypothetical protein GX787_07620 [Tissierellia bacterium]|nr:hypothetical protein [Tissierellia bacterium]